MKTRTLLSLAISLLLTTSLARAASDSNNFDTQLTIDAANMKGNSFVVPESGDYTFTILSGAFCYLPGDGGVSEFGGWLSQLEIHTEAVVWGDEDQWGKHPLGADGNVGNVTHQKTKAQAEAAGKGATSTIYLVKGSRVTLLVSDGSNYYTDNLGSVTVRITTGMAPPPAANQPETSTILDTTAVTPTPEPPASPAPAPSAPSSAGSHIAPNLP